LLFLPKHSSWLNQVEIVFGIIMRKVIRRGNFSSVEDLEVKLKAFLAYFNLVLAHPFNWTYTGQTLGQVSATSVLPAHRRHRFVPKLNLAKTNLSSFAI